MKEKSIKSSIILTMSILLMVSMLFQVPQNAKAQSTLNPNSVSISGSVVDNYANYSYEYLFDNTASEEAVEIEWFFELSDGVRLSNISLLLGDLMYWGHAKPEIEAIHEYNQTVQQNRTGVLVRRIGDQYKLSFNIENGTEALLTIYAEGLLTRYKGLYKIDFPITDEFFSADFSFDLTVVSDFGNIEGYYLEGLSSFNVDDLSDGIRVYRSMSGVIIPHQISLTYFLERQEGGSQLMTYNNGTEDFFMYLLAPSTNESDVLAPKQYIFVIDISGSMAGTKIAQAKIAFSSMLYTLNTNDWFNIVAFYGDVTTLWAEARLANAQNIEFAEDFVESLTAGGGTNFYGACMTGLSLFTESEYIKVMIVLSDGEPTSGEITDPDLIEDAVVEANTLGVSISTIALGVGANQEMMSTIAAQNNGAFIFISDDDEAATKILDFYYQYSTPLAYNYTFEISGEIEFNSRCSLEETPFFNGSEIVICGRYHDSMTIDTLIHYISGPESYHNTGGAGDPDNPHVAYSWAQTKIDQLLMIVDKFGETKILRHDIVSLALEYGLIVEGYTAIILKVEEPELPTQTTTTISEMTASYTTTPIPLWTPGAGTYATTTGYFDYYSTTSTEPASPISPAQDFTLSIIAFAAVGSISIIIILIILNKYRFSRS